MHCRNVGSANQITEELRSHDNHTQASSTQYNGDEEDIGEAIASATEKLGYNELRKNQELVVRHFLRERDVFVSLPTGQWQESLALCYCLLPLVFDFLRHYARAQCIVQSLDHSDARSSESHA